MQSITVISSNPGFIKSIKDLSVYIKDETNVAELIFESNLDKYQEYKVEPNNQKCGQDLKDKFNKDFITQVRNMT